MIAGSEMRFACTRCLRCCLEPGYVFFSPRDRRTAARHLGIGADAFRERFGGDDDGTEIRVTRRRRCPFLGETGCTIYPARPEQCRTFPFWPEMTKSARAWNETAARCPGMMPIDRREARARTGEPTPLNR